MDPAVRLVPATERDVPLILQLITELAAYEKLAHHVVATEAALRQTLFGERPAAEVVIACAGEEPIGFALWFYNYSTFLAKPGLYLEDLFVRPEWRGRGVGKALLTHLARIAIERGCGRMEWSVLDWNAPAIGFYASLGARAVDGWSVFRLDAAGIATLAAR